MKIRNRKTHTQSTRLPESPLHPWSGVPRPLFIAAVLFGCQEVPNSGVEGSDLVTSSAGESDDEMAQVESAIVHGPIASGGYERGAVIVDGGCSGNLITNEWVLTAQHCIRDYYRPPEGEDSYPGGLYVRTTPGDHRIYFRGTRDYPEQTREVVQINHHPGNVNDPHANDLVLMKVSPPFSVDSSTSGFRTPLFPYQAGSALWNWAGQYIEIVGFGNTVATPCSLPGGECRDGSSPAQQAMMTNNPFWKFETPASESERIFVSRNQQMGMFLPGDSGGPWLKNIAGVNYQVSVSAASVHGLTDGNGSYLGVKNVREWIYRAIIGDNVLTHRVSSTDAINSNIGATSSESKGVVYLFWVNGSQKLVRYKFDTATQRISKVDELSPPSRVTFSQDKPAGVVWRTNQLDLFARGTNNKLYQRTFANGSWNSAWTEVGTNVGSAAAVTSFASGRLDLFWRASGTSQLNYRMYSGSSWATPQTSLSNPFVGDPVVVKGLDPASSDSDKSIIRVFMRLSDNQVVLWNAPKGIIGSYAFQNWGGSLPWGPAAAAPEPGRVDVFGADTDGKLQYRWIESQILDQWVDTTSPEILGGGDEHLPTGTGGVAPNVPVAVTAGDGITHVFAIGRDRLNLWHTQYGGLSSDRICYSGGQYDYCLDSVTGNATSGTRPTTTRRLGYQDTQFWTFTSDGTIRTPSLCLSVVSGSTAAGEFVELATCSAQASQKWDRQGRWIRNRNSGLCLTVQPDGLKQMPCSDPVSTAQQWFVDRPAVGRVSMTNHPGYCLDVRNGSSTDGTPIQVYTCNGSAAQRVNVYPYGRDRVIRILDKCLDIVNGDIAEGAKVQLFECNGTAAQLWQVLPDGSLRNPQSGYCLDLVNDDPAYLDASNQPSQLQIYRCNGTNAQKWTLPALVPSK